jgi:lysine-specific permease
MNGTIWRIVLFFVGAVFIMGLVIPYDDPNLAKIGGVNNIAVSPFTLVFKKSGIPGADHIMNAVILTTILSAGNSGLYLCTRIFWTLAMEGKAPKIFCRLTRGGIPIWCLVLTTVLATSLFGLSFVGNQVIYIWLVNMTSVMGFIAWFGIAISHWRFRRAFILQGYSLDDLIYKALFFPIGPFLASALIIICVFGQGYSAFTTNTVNCTTALEYNYYLFNEINGTNGTNGTCTENSFNLSTFLSGYIILPVFVLMFVIYKVVNKTRFIPLKEIDLITDSVVQHPKRDTTITSDENL